MKVFWFLLGLLAIAGGAVLLTTSLGHLLGLREGGDTFDVVLPVPAALLLIAGMTLCWRAWSR